MDRLARVRGLSVFGNIPWVKQNLTFIVIGIVVVSLLPAVTTFLQERRAARQQPARETVPPTRS